MKQVSHLPARLATGFSCVSMLGLLAACNHQNDRNEIGNTVSLPALSAEPMPSDIRPDDPSSLTSLDRSGWSKTVVLVPVHGIAHGPTYTTRHRSTDATARQRGEPPTALTALELEGDTGWTQVADSAEAPFVCMWDTLLILPRAIVERPWTEVRGDQEPYWRSSVWDARTQPSQPAPATVVPPAAEPAPEAPEASNETTQ